VWSHKMPPTHPAHVDINPSSIQLAPPSIPICEGVLHKHGAAFRQYPRHVTLNPEILFWCRYGPFGDGPVTKGRQMGSVRMDMVRNAAQTGPCTFNIHLSGDDHVAFSVDAEGDAVKWVQGINACAEYQRRLKELQEDKWHAEAPSELELYDRWCERVDNELEDRLQHVKLRVQHRLIATHHMLQQRIAEAQEYGPFMTEDEIYHEDRLHEVEESYVSMLNGEFLRMKAGQRHQWYDTVKQDAARHKLEQQMAL